MENLGKKIKELRMSNELTQPELAKELNVSNGIISAWENNLYEPKATYLKKIAYYFKIPTDYLLGMEDNIPIKNNESISKISFDGKRLIEIFEKLPELERGMLLSDAEYYYKTLTEKQETKKYK